MRELKAGRERADGNDNAPVESKLAIHVYLFFA
jgi:hypothetical protein